MSDAIRLATAGDLPAIRDLIDRCFHRTAGGHADEWPHCYAADGPECHAVIEREGEIVSQVGYVPDRVVVGDGRLETWGISSVATDPRYRGEGHMSALLQFWLDRMDEAGIPLSKLGGDRTRYGRFGWENAGRDRIYRVMPRSLDWETGAVKRYDGGDADLATIRELYESKPLRVDRDDADYRGRLGRGHIETLLYAGDGDAYLSFTRGSSEGAVLEAAGEPRGLRALLGHALEAYDLSELRCHVHPTDPLVSFFAAPDVSNGRRSRPHRMINVRDLPAVLSAFEGQMADRLGGVDDGELAVGIEGDDGGARIAWSDGNLSVTETERVDLELDRLAATRLFFGDPATVPDYRGHPLLDAVLPLDFYVPRTDQI